MGSEALNFDKEAYLKRMVLHDENRQEIRRELDNLCCRVRERLSYDDSAVDTLYHLRQARKAFSDESE